MQDIKQSFTVKIARVQSTFYSVLKRLFTSVFSYCSAVFMDTNYHSNRIVSTRSNPSYFAGSVNRQYGSGIGSAVRIGLRSFVIPLAKKYGIPFAKNLLTSAAPEVLELIDGKTKPKAAIKRVVKNTIKKQVGAGRRKRSVKRRRKPTTLSNQRRRRRRRRKSAGQRRRRRRVTKTTAGRQKRKPRTKTTKVKTRKATRKRPAARTRQDFFSSCKASRGRYNGWKNIFCLR